MTADAWIATGVALLSGTIGGRLWSTRNERGEDYKRLIDLYKDEVKRCTEHSAECQQKLMIFMKENVELRHQLETSLLQNETMELTIIELEHKIENLKC